MDKKLASIIIGCVIVAFALMFLVIALRKKKNIITQIKQTNNELRNIEKDESSDFYQYIKGKSINGEKYDETLNITPSNCRGLCDGDGDCIGSVYRNGGEKVCELYKNGVLKNSLDNNYAYIKTKFLIA